MEDVKKQVAQLIKKAAEAEKSEDAIRFSQAATNAANAFAVFWNVENPR